MKVICREVTWTELGPVIAERRRRDVDPTPPRVWLGAFVGNTLAAIASVQRLDAFPRLAVLRDSYTRLAFRRRGVYRTLSTYRLQWCHTHGIDVVFGRCTAMSLPLYQRHGFTVPPDWPKLTPIVADLRELSCAR